MNPETRQRLSDLSTMAKTIADALVRDDNHTPHRCLSNVQYAVGQVKLLQNRLEDIQTNLEFWNRYERRIDAITDKISNPDDIRKLLAVVFNQFDSEDDSDKQAADKLISDIEKNLKT